MAVQKLKLVINPITGQFDLVNNVSQMVDGPASATDLAIAIFDGTTGKIIKNSLAFVQSDGRITLGADGSGSLDAVTKQQLDAAIQGVVIKTGVVAATTANITLSGEQTIDGIALVTGDRCLVKNQLTQTQNGIYIVDSGAWTRSTDADTGSELNHALVTVQQGTTQANSGWYQATDNPVIGSSNIVWQQFFGAGTYTTDGQGIELVGNTFVLELDGTTLSKSASGLRVAALGITNSEISNTAAIAYSKLLLTNSIVDADIATAAGIALSKLAALTADRALISSAGGVITVSSVTATELSYVGGVTSAIQTQLDTKVTNPMTTGGDMIYGGALGVPTRLANGTAGYFLSSQGGTSAPLWKPAPQQINYITNPNAVTGVSPWVTYADAAQSTPVNGVGGTPNITLTQDTNSLTIGVDSFLITKDAANRQGQGVSCDFAIDSSIKGTPVDFSFYCAPSANFVYGAINGSTNSDIMAFVYSIDDNALVAVFPNVITNSGYFVGQFQATQATNYRVILHIATTNALAWTFAFSEVVVTPSQSTFIQSDSDWVSYTPTYTNAGTVTTTYAQYRKVGPNMEVRVKASGNNYAGSPLKVSFPAGLTANISTDTLAEGNTGTTYAGGDVRGLSPIVLNSEKTVFQIGGNSTRSVFNPINANYMNNNDVFIINASIPIQGWTSGYATPAVSAQNVPVTFSAIKNGGSITADTTIASWTTVQDDSVGAFNSSTGQYTLKYPGKYRVTFNMQITAGASSLAAIRLNGNVIAVSVDSSAGSKGVTVDIPNLIVGDIITVTNSTNATISSNTNTKFQVTRINDPSAFLNIPKIAFIKEVLANNTDAGGSNTSYTNRTLNTLEDPYGIVTSLSSNQFVLQPGRYLIKGKSSAYISGFNKLQLYNVTTATPAILGKTEYAGGSGSSDRGTGFPSFDGYVDISVPTTFSVRQRSSTSVAGNGWGDAANFGDSEVYTVIEIQKLL